MSSQNIRLALLAAVLFLGMMLYNAWQKDHAKEATLANTKSTTLTEHPQDKDIPVLSAKEGNVRGSKGLGKNASGNESSGEGAKGSITGTGTGEASGSKSQQIRVKTDVLDLLIDPMGGDITYLNLPAYPESKEDKSPYLLLDDSAKRYYIAQSGLTGEDGPDRRGVGRAVYQVSKTQYELQPDQDRLEVLLKTKAKEGINITKRFVFYRGEYNIDVAYLIDNDTAQDYKGNMYARLKRKPEQSSGGGLLGIQTYTGAAIHTNSSQYKKISFKDIEEKPFTEEVKNGWVAMVEHYFVSAWIPEPDLNYTYQTTHLPDGADVIGFVSPTVVVPAKSQETIQAKLYAGPQITNVLEKLAPGLELSVDYGVLWPICQPIFWLLKKINEFVGNWGWSIVIITIIIKLLFYKLSASSYRSMGNMRKLQPRIEALKERYGEDKQKFSQAVMELYKKEKINPLGGCLPILIQIPVFIALYYVLLGSVELRQAPFILWIHDLSAKDPYYVLPVLMGLSMLVQQKLNPPPPDPVQAKVMMFMPVIFTVLFLNFPAGLVLYWFVNNVLSILQQWMITRNMGRVSHGAA